MNESNRKLLFSRPETAEMLNISVATLDRMLRLGKINFTRIGDRPLFSIDDIQNFIESRKQCNASINFQGGRK